MFLTLLVLLASAAHGGAASESGLRVDDPFACVSREPLELELRTVLGDERFDAFSIVVTLSAADDAPAGQRVLALKASRLGQSAWSRTLPVSEADCPYLTGLVVLSVEQGLATIPAWDLAPPRHPPPELGFVVSATFPLAVRIATGGSLWVSLSEWLRWDVQPDLMWSAVERFGSGGAQMAGVAVGTGPGIELSRGGFAGRMAIRLGSGVGVGVGRGFSDGNYARSWPRLFVGGDVGVTTGEALRLAVRTEVPILRVRYTDLFSGEQYPEPSVRIGLALSIAGSLTRSDGGRNRGP